MMAHVRIEAVSKRFGSGAAAVTAVDAVSLDIERGEFFCLLGGSGSGKTTILRMLAGFEQPSEGRIMIDGADMTGVPPHRRPVNMMFQSYALFPHMTVAANVGYGLAREGLPPSEIADRVGAILDLVQMPDLGARRPDQLSGGQRQRVALARALVKRPKLLLLDEPLAALDKRLRETTQVELMRIQQQLGVTFVMVTHDQNEAMTLASRIGVMNDGRLEQVDRPQRLYEHPRSRRIAAFFGSINLITCDVVALLPGARRYQLSTRGMPSGPTNLTAESAADLSIGSVVSLGVRPEKMTIETERAARTDGDGNALAGVVEEMLYMGDLTAVRVALVNGCRITVTRPNAMRTEAAPFAKGQRVFVIWPADAGIVLTS